MSKSFTWSDQQIAIFDEFLNPTSPILAIQAIFKKFKGRMSVISPFYLARKNHTLNAVCTLI